MKNIKAIIFDAYGTLFDVNSAAQKCKNKIGDKWKLLQIIGELIN
jgi:2-haloacid dehalogenase